MVSASASHRLGKNEPTVSRWSSKYGSTIPRKARQKSVVIGLAFLKYINDCFMTKCDELVAEDEGFEEDADEYIGDNIFAMGLIKHMAIPQG